MGWGRLGMRCIRNGEYSERGSFVGGSGVGGWGRWWVDGGIGWDVWFLFSGFRSCRSCVRWVIGV